MLYKTLRKGGRQSISVPLERFIEYVPWKSGLPTGDDCNDPMRGKWVVRRDYHDETFRSRSRRGRWSAEDGVLSGVVWCGVVWCGVVFGILRGLVEWGSVWSTHVGFSSCRPERRLTVV
eukprot:1187197-Prorocentrum_minimum.AAC.5